MGPSHSSFNWEFNTSISLVCLDMDKHFLTVSFYQQILSHDLCKRKIFAKFYFIWSKTYSKFKVRKHDKYRRGCFQHLEHMQAPNGTAPGVQRSILELGVCFTHAPLSDTTVDLNHTNRGVVWGGVWTWILKSRLQQQQWHFCMYKDKMCFIAKSITPFRHSKLHSNDSSPRLHFVNHGAREMPI